MAFEMSDRMKAFIREMPKTDLHVHLDGSLRLSTLIDLAKSQSMELPSYTEEGLRETVFKPSYSSLEEYLEGFKFTVGVMQTAEAVERVAFEFAEDNYSEGVRYVEVRFAPQLFADAMAGFGLDDVIRAVNAGMARATEAFNAKLSHPEEPRYAYGIIVCAMRAFGPEFSPWFAQFCEIHKFESPKRLQSLASMILVTTTVALRDSEGLPLVGLDIAGPENGFPAQIHSDAYDYAHKHFLKKTVHAGESYGPESIFQAVTKLHAERIGHGLSLCRPQDVKDMSPEEAEKYVSNITQYIANDRTHVEVCMTSNLQTCPGLTIKDHPIQRMIDERLSLSLCTDNRLVSNTTTVKEHVQLLETFPVDAKRFKDLVINGFKRCFFPGSYVEKRRYVRQVISLYEAMERKFGLVSTPIPGSPARGPLLAAMGPPAMSSVSPPPLPPSDVSGVEDDK